MHIKEFVDLKILQDIQDQFSEATGLAAIAVDAEGNYITKGSNFTDFCMKFTRGSQEGQRRCVQCDNECTGTYFCHAGLMDFSSDIVVNGEKVGAIIGGQVLPGPPDEEKFRAIARELGVREEDYIQALRKVPVRSERMIRAAAAMLGDVVNRLVNLEYFKTVNRRRAEIFDSEAASALHAAAGVGSKVQELQQLSSMERILAINASIEAGRAGQAGVGFSIVAKEMGNLSQQSAAIYSAIQELAKQIETSVKKLSET